MKHCRIPRRPGYSTEVPLQLTLLKRRPSVLPVRRRHRPRRNLRQSSCRHRPRSRRRPPQLHLCLRIVGHTLITVMSKLFRQPSPGLSITYLEPLRRSL